MTWRRLVVIAAVANAILLAIAALSRLDREAAAIAFLAAGVATFVHLRPRRPALLIAFLLFANVAFWMVTASISNLGTREALGVILIPLALAVTSVAGLIAALSSFVTPSSTTTRRWPAGLAGLAVAAFVLIAGVAAARSNAEQAQQPGDIALRMHNTAYSTTSINAGSGSDLYIINDDLFWHTVTIDNLGIDLKVPVGSHRRIRLDAPAGTYTFYCRIPGHAQAGMKGTVTLR